MYLNSNNKLSYSETANNKLITKLSYRPTPNAERAKTPIPINRSNYSQNNSSHMTRQYSPMRSVNVPLPITNPIPVARNVQMSRAYSPSSIQVVSNPIITNNSFCVDQNLLIGSPIHTVQVSREYSPIRYNASHYAPNQQYIPMIPSATQYQDLRILPDVHHYYQPNSRPVYGELTESRNIIKEAPKESRETAKANAATPQLKTEAEHRRVKSYTMANQTTQATEKSTVSIASQLTSAVKTNEFNVDMPSQKTETYVKNAYPAGFNPMRVTAIPGPVFESLKNPVITSQNPQISSTTNTQLIKSNIMKNSNKDPLDESFQRLIAKAGNILKNYEEGEKNYDMKFSRENHHLSKGRKEGPLQFVGFGKPITVYTPSPERNVVLNGGVINTSNIISTSGVVGLDNTLASNSGVYSNSGLSGFVYAPQVQILPHGGQLIASANSSQILGGSQRLSGGFGNVIHNTTISPTLNVITTSARNSFGKEN